MTIAEMIKLAEKIERHGAAHGAADEAADQLAAAVIDLLGESAPCGWEAPTIDDDRTVTPIAIPESWGGSVHQDDARAMGRLLFLAADEVEAGNG